MFVKQLVQRAGRQGVLDARPRHHRQRFFLSKALEDSWQDHSPHLPVVSPLSLAVLIFYGDLSPGQGATLEVIGCKGQVVRAESEPDVSAVTRWRQRAGMVWRKSPWI